MLFGCHRGDLVGDPILADRRNQPATTSANGTGQEPAGGVGRATGGVKGSTMSSGGVGVGVAQPIQGVADRAGQSLRPAAPWSTGDGRDGTSAAETTNPSATALAYRVDTSVRAASIRSQPAPAANGRRRNSRARHLVGGARTMARIRHVGRVGRRPAPVRRHASDPTPTDPGADRAGDRVPTVGELV